MIRVLAKWWAKKQYVWKQEVEAATADLHAGLSLKLAAEKRAKIAQLNKEADDIETNIKAVDEKLATGYWECENGHESENMPNVRPAQDRPANLCVVKVNGKECGGEVNLVSQATMTGQDKYESDKERKEAEAMAENKRAQAKAEEENVKGSEQTAKYFQDQARNNRSISQKVRTL